MEYGMSHKIHHYYYDMMMSHSIIINLHYIIVGGVNTISFPFLLTFFTNPDYFHFPTGLKTKPKKLP